MFVSRESRDFMYRHSKWATQIDALHGWGWVLVWSFF